MPREIVVTATVKIPSVPNFLRAEGVTLPLDAVSEEDLREIGAAWTDNLLKRAAELRLATTEGEET